MEKPTPPKDPQPGEAPPPDYEASTSRDTPLGSPPPQAFYPPQQNSFPPQQGGYYPPQDGIPLQEQPQYQQQTSVPLAALQTQSAPVICPKCGNRAMTDTAPEAGGFTHFIAAAVCFTTCLGCIPYCINSLKDVHHRCGKCGVPLARYHRSGRTEVMCYAG